MHPLGMGRALCVPHCSRGRGLDSPDAVRGLDGSRTSGAGARRLTTRSLLESDSELESPPLSGSP